MSGYRCLMSAISHFQKRKWFCMGIVDAEDADALIDPVLHDGPEFSPQFVRGGALEIQWINILVLFGWIFRKLNRAVRTGGKPFRVCCYVRMIGRTLKGHIERELNALGLSCISESLEIVQRSEIRMDGCMPALAPSDRPGTAC